MLKIEKYFYYFKVSKEEGAIYICGALTRNVQLWWDEFQHDRHRFAGALPINTCELMVLLLIEEYYPNDFEEINQPFVWIYEDFEEVEVQSQNSSINDVPKGKGDTCSI